MARTTMLMECGENGDDYDKYGKTRVRDGDCNGYILHNDGGGGVI